MRTYNSRSISMFFAGAITAMILIAILTIAIPPFRAIAMEWIGFERASSNRIETTDGPQAGFAELPDLVIAEHLTEYALREPSTLPEGYRFATGKHWPKFNMIELTYRRPHPDDLRRTQSLYVRQWPFDSSSKSALVGSDAHIESAQIGDVEGQFVTGVWIESPAGDALSWDSTVSFQKLRWHDGDVVLELEADSGVFTKEELIDIAKSVRIPS